MRDFLNTLFNKVFFLNFIYDNWYDVFQKKNCISRHCQNNVNFFPKNLKTYVIYSFECANYILVRKFASRDTYIINLDMLLLLQELISPS